MSWLGVATIITLSCSSDPTGTVTIVTGDETDAFSRTPAPVLLIADKVDLTGAHTEIARANLPTADFSLGDLTQTDVGGIAITAVDASGKVLLRGESLFVQWGALANSSLSVFVQRTGEFARMPSDPPAMDIVSLTTVVGRYVLTANGTASQIYDLLALAPLTPPPVLPRAPKSSASFGTAALLIDETGATTFDLEDGTTSDLAAPAGGNFAEIAGGDRVASSDNSQFIVGGTRITGASTPRVLLIDPTGAASFAALTSARLGACSTYVEGRGVVVYGGDPKAAGAEILAPSATVATALPYPPDPVVGCSLATLDNQHVLVAGGTGAVGDTGAGLPARVIDLGCTTACVPTPWKDALVLARAQSFGLAADAALIVGDDAAGSTHAFRVSAAELHEVPLRIVRTHAKMFVTPINSVGVIGGGVGLEQYLE